MSRQERRNAPAPGAPELPAVGARVRCEGLTGAAELNGCLGHVESHEGAPARVKVRMDGPGNRVVGRVVGVKPQNLVIVVAGGDWRTQTETASVLFDAIGAQDGNLTRVT